MKAFALRVMSVVAGAAFALGCLCSCAFLGEPTSTEDLLMRFAANPQNTNFMADGSADLALTLAGYRLQVPILGHAEVADDSAHVKVDVDMTSFCGEHRTYEAYGELEGNSIVAYVQDTSKGTQAWNKAEIDLSFHVDIPAIVDILSSARFMRVSYDSDDQIRYELTLPASSVVDAVFGRGDVSTSFWKADSEELKKVLGGSMLHVCFNKDCLVRSVSLDMDYTFEKEKVLSHKLFVDLEVQATLDGYGTLDSKTTAVPDAVRDAGVATDDPLSLNGLTAKLAESVGSN